MDNAQLINQYSGVQGYRTPVKIIEAARCALGGMITLDPASSAAANATIKAEHFYAEADNGLLMPWFGSVWLNHPFGIAERACKPNCQKKICKKRGYHLTKDDPGTRGWIEKLICEYASGRVDQACSISFVSTSEKWFRPLLACPICFLHGRLNYLLPDGTESGGSTRGSCVVYLGRNVERFADAFSEHGSIMIPY